MTSTLEITARQNRETVQGAIRLHPNLARIAAAYQDLTNAYAAGRVTSQQAALFARELVARDDEGTQWTINSRDGGWLRFTRSGEWVSDTPPSQGVATLSAWDVSDASGPETAISYQTVGHPAAGAATGLRNATHRYARRQRDLSSMSRPRWVYPIFVTVALGAVLWVGLVALDDGKPVFGSSAQTLPPNGSVTTP